MSDDSQARIINQDSWSVSVLHSSGVEYMLVDPSRKPNT